MWTKLAFAAAGLATASAGCGGVENDLPIYTGAPELVDTTTNGKLYEVGPSDQLPLKVLQLYGDSYDRGLAYGTLLADDLTEFVEAVYAYFQGEIDPFLQFLPAAVRPKLEMLAIDGILDFYWHHTQEQVPQYYKDTMQGMADGSGIAVEDIQRVNMITEAIRMECSIVLADGPATSTGGMFQVRALDFSTDGPFQEHKVAAIHHPTEEGAQTYVNIGFAGLVGAISGFSDSPLGVSEKVNDNYPYEDDDEGDRPFAFNGEPTAMLLNDLLMWETTVDGAVERAQNVNRTNAIFIGVGSTVESPEHGTKAIMQYNKRHLNVWDEESFPYYGNHTQQEGLIYLDKHVQPSSDSCMTDLMHEYYGQIDADTLIHKIMAIEQTGDEQALVYDFEKKQVYVSFASPAGDDEVDAYDRQYTQLDMATLFAEEL